MSAAVGWTLVRDLHRGTACDLDREIRTAYERYPFPYPLDREYEQYGVEECRAKLDQFRAGNAELLRQFGLTPDFARGLALWDLGCGVGWRAMAFASEGARTVHAFDASENAIRWGRRFARLLGIDHLHFHPVNLYDLGSYDGAGEADLIFSTGTLHHVFDLDRAARAVAARCREGTRFYFTHSSYHSRLGLVKYYKNYLSWARGGLELERRLEAGRWIWSRWIRTTPEPVRKNHLNDLAGVFYMARSPRRIVRIFEKAGFEMRRLPPPRLTEQMERLRGRLERSARWGRKPVLKKLFSAVALGFSRLPLPGFLDRALGSWSSWWFEMQPHCFRAVHRGR